MAKPAAAEDPCKGRPPAGAAARKQAVDCGRGASRKAACGQKHRPLPARTRAAPIEALLAVTAPTGKGSAACTGAAATTKQKGNMGLGHLLEKRMILPV
ncbi:hypothetical protein BHE74_00049433 [Ensete ventricosum]|nr:hypothetical protein BHE74_00049433 [Ensete ventricosum]